MKVKVKPETLLEKFEMARELSFLAGFRVFPPSRRYFRAEHQFIAASNDTKAKGVFRIWIRKNELWMEFLPFFENRKHKQFLEEELNLKIKQRQHKPAMRRFDPAHKMVAASQHYEFNLLIPPIQLP